MDKPSKNIDKLLLSLEPASTSALNIEEVTLKAIPELSYGYTMFDAFDDIITSKNLPFAQLKTETKELFKINENAIIDPKWVEEKESKEQKVVGIYFKLKTGEKYSDCEWLWDDDDDVDNSINIMLDYKSGKDDITKKNIVDGLDVKIKDIVQSHIKSTFQVYVDVPAQKYSVFNRVIFADMIETDPLFKKYLFINDYVDYMSHKKITTIDKDRFSFYFKFKNDYSKKDAFFITITPSEESYNMIKVRAARVKEEESLKKFVTIFSKLFSYYIQKRGKVGLEDKNVVTTGIMGIYYELLGKKDSKSLAKNVYEQKYAGKIVANLKTKERLDDLKSNYPNFFSAKGTNFSTRCQHKDQPYIVKPEEVKDTIKKFKNTYKLANPENLIKEYTYKDRETKMDVTFKFACAPRHKNETSSIYPVIKKPSEEEKLKNFYIEDEFKTEGVPCCASKLKKDLKNVSKSYVVSNQKFLEDGRFGTVPFNLEPFIKAAGYDKIYGEKENLYPFQRYGIAPSPNSFLFCMERIFNDNYSLLSPARLEEKIKVVKREMTEMNLELVKQHFPYDNYEYIKKTLLTQIYFDPNLFKELVEEYYSRKTGLRCAIHIIQSDNNGSLPFVDQKFLRPCEKYDVHVIICKFGLLDSVYPYKCDLIVKAYPRPVIFKFENSEPFIKQIVKFEKNSHQISFITADEGLWKYPY